MSGLGFFQHEISFIPLDLTALNLRHVINNPLWHVNVMKLCIFSREQSDPLKDLSLVVDAAQLIIFCMAGHTNFLHGKTIRESNLAFGKESCELEWLIRIDFYAERSAVFRGQQGSNRNIRLHDRNANGAIVCSDIHQHLTLHPHLLQKTLQFFVRKCVQYSCPRSFSVARWKFCI
ncbi:hypothetical protein A2881_01480 [Candidatus Peribacteria bacterium RIFCSPHIGHO2_01_FULL_55_13]|nr:MAG: hypothetical protein A2881_01480 [Candidatus Peribacteria bacterium RIFCSPHIGHO2_01_FULL_55_13]OGJ64888.1 MAG: hypothetical protein A3F36_01955 [Candidatus Peribacteria bacterium RIFCSPHIGHO2_12_FULL_55_11]